MSHDFYFFLMALIYFYIVLLFVCFVFYYYNFFFALKFHSVSSNGETVTMLPLAVILTVF